MQLSEKELEKIIRSVPSIGPYHAGAGEAARLIAEKLAEGVVWRDKFQLDDMGYLNILARTGPMLDEPDERGIWFENNVMPSAWVELTVTVTKEE